MPKVENLLRTPREWVEENPILGVGQVGVEKFTNKYKVGNGRTPWTYLNYGLTTADVSGLVPQTTGWRTFGDFDVTKEFSRGGQAALSPGFKAGYGWTNTVGAVDAVALRRTGTVVEAAISLVPNPEVLNSGSPSGPDSPFSSYTVFDAAYTGFDVTYAESHVIPLSVPLSGFSATIVLYPPDPGSPKDYPGTVRVTITKATDASWDDALPYFVGQTSWVTTAPFPDKVGGQRWAGDPVEIGMPSAPLPSALRMFTNMDIPSVASQPTAAGKRMAIGPIANRDLMIGYGDYNENTGPLDIVSWNLDSQQPVVHATGFRSEQDTVMRTLNDGWVWYVNLDPKDDSTDYLYTNAPVPGPGGLPPETPTAQQFRPVSGVNPSGLSNMVHVFDVAQTSDGTLYICGARNWTADETTAAGFDPAADNSMACVWRSTDGGVTWFEVVKTWHPGGPNGYSRIYLIGQIGDRLFVPSYRPVAADGSYDVDGFFRGYWEKGLDDVWVERGPLDSDDSYVIVGGAYGSAPIPRLPGSFAGSYAVGGSIVFTYTDHLVATVDTTEQGKIAVDAGNGSIPAGFIANTIDPVTGYGGALKFPDGSPLATDRIPTGSSFPEWTFATDVDNEGQFYVCNGYAVYRITSRIPGLS